MGTQISRQQGCPQRGSRQELAWDDRCCSQWEEWSSWRSSPQGRTPAHGETSGLRIPPQSDEGPDRSSRGFQHPHFCAVRERSYSIAVGSHEHTEPALFPIIRLYWNNDLHTPYKECVLSIVQARVCFCGTYDVRPRRMSPPPEVMVVCERNTLIAIRIRTNSALFLILRIMQERTCRHSSVWRRQYVWHSQ